MTPAAPVSPPGRGAKVRAAVLAATFAELVETGYAEMTIDNIARRAGVHKTTVYRRWPDRESLLADVVGEHLALDFPIPDTGSVEADLRHLAQALVDWVTSPTGRAIFNAIYANATPSPGIFSVRRELFGYGPRRAAVVIERAMDRGELPAGTDAEPVFRTLVAPVYFQVTVTNEPLDSAIVEQSVQVTLAAARAGTFTPEA